LLILFVVVFLTKGGNMKTFLKRLENVAKLNLPIDQYLIWGSGPLAIRGIREARDIDIIVTGDLWKKLIKKYEPVGLKKNNINIDDIEIWNDLLSLTNRMDEIITDREIIHGFPFMKLSYTLEWKKGMNIQKHSDDIVLIEDLLQKEKVNN
jgi:hypothetical protein